MSEDDSGLGLKVHEDAYRELERERDEWKARYINQNKDLGCEMMDPAGTIWDYASATQRENVQLKREVERERALANEAIATWRKTREERDAALIGYNECRATIEDARRALGATAHEGPLLAAMRVTEQRDRAQSKIENQAERIKYLEGATNHATGTPLSKMREQRDRLAEALKDVMKYRKGEEPYDYWRLPESHRRNVQFDGWNEIENRINAALAAVKGGSDE
jgi:hypothetical protein